MFTQSKALLHSLGLVLSLTLISGCSNIISATTDEPIRPDPGKRTFGTMIDDEQLETIARVNLNKADPALEASHINVVAYNGIVLLTGQVPSQQLRTLATNTVVTLPKVRQVFNEMQIQGKTSLLARTNDTWLTTKVKTKLISHKDIDSGRIKIVTEDGVIYLMGMLSRVQAEKAAEVARTTGGVQKVVKAIEYID
jgi:osmotically-inducible protein OsmY